MEPEDDDTRAGMNRLSSLFGPAPPAPPASPYPPSPSLPPASTSTASAPPASRYSPSDPALPIAPGALATPPAPMPAVPATPAVAPAFGGATIASLAPSHWATVSAVPGSVAARFPTTAPDAPAPVAAPSVPSAPAPSGAPPAWAPAPSQPLAGPLLPGGPPDDDLDDEPLARSTVGERVLFAVAFVPFLGLVGSVIAALRSARRRGWVIALLRAGIAVAIVTSVVGAVGVYAGYKAYRQQEAHAAIAAASAAFCAALQKDPTMDTPDGGWPQPATTIPDSLTSMQAYVARWTALQQTSPAGIQPGIGTIVAAANAIVGRVTTQRTVDDAANRTQLQSAIAASGVVGWRAEYCA